MSSRLRLLHGWMRQVAALLPEARVTRCRVLAVFALGMIGAGTVRVNQVAAALPLPVRVPRTARRWRRFLANPAVGGETVWRPLLPVLLARWAGPEGLLVCAPTPYRVDGTVRWVGSVVPRRRLPLAWGIMPQQHPGPETVATLLPALLAPIAAALPPGCQVTWLGDRGVSGPPRIAVAARCGWAVLRRRNVSATQAHRLRLVPAAEPATWATWRLWAWGETGGPGWHGPGQLFQDAGWRRGELTVPRRPGSSEWWILFSTRPGGGQRVREDARRRRVAATFADSKGRGWGLEQSRLTNPRHLDRLLLVWPLARWWRHAWGRHVIKRGWRPHCDRSDRRDRSLVRLGWLWLHAALLHGRCPPLLFRQTNDGWYARGTP